MLQFGSASLGALNNNTAAVSLGAGLGELSAGLLDPFGTQTGSGGVGDTVYSGAALYFQSNYVELPSAEASLSLFKSKLAGRGYREVKADWFGFFTTTLTATFQAGAVTTSKARILSDCRQSMMDAGFIPVEPTNLDVTWQPGKPVMQVTNPTTQQLGEKQKLQALGLDEKDWQINPVTGEPEKKPKDIGTQLSDFFSKIGTMGAVLLIVGIYAITRE